MTSVAELLHERQPSGSEGTPAELTRHASVSAANRDQGAAAENTPEVFRRNDWHGRSESIRVAYERSHPEDSFEDLQRRARFSKEAKGLLRDWLAIADRI